MNTQTSLRIIVLSTILLLASSTRAGTRTKEFSRPPNVVLIMADDLGYEALQCYGGASYKTPELDKLAANGVRFDNAFALPICTPTRVSLMTGKYNWRNWHSFGILDPDSKTFGHWMSDAGYKTCIAGKWQLQSYNPPEFMPEYRGLGQRVEDAGFDEYFLFHDAHTEDKGSRYPDPKINKNGKYLENTKGLYGPDLYSDFINDFMEKNKDDPFFVYYPMALTHAPFQATPDSPEWQTDDHHTINEDFFSDMVEYMDRTVAKIVKKVEDLGLTENTLIIFYGDNGSPRHVRTLMQDGRIIKGGKADNNLRGTHVPLIVSIPGYAKANHVVDDLVDSNDILPTIFDFCGVPLPENEVFDGQSVLPQIRGEKGSHRDWLFFHHDPLPGHDKERFTLERWAMDKRWKLNETTGKFYDLIADPEEENPIDAQEHGIQAIVAKAKLQAVIDNMGLEYEPWIRPTNK